MKMRDWLFGLHELKGIGEVTVDTLLKKLSSLDQIASMEAKDLQKIGISPARASLIKRSLHESFVAERYERYHRLGIQPIVIGDEDYPEQLSEIPHAPRVIYVRGDVRVLQLPSIAVVGTRRATMYGRRATKVLVSELSMHGFGIVSGMARGIDTEAHRTSLQERAPSIAVLGTGHDVAYPRENKPLIERMAAEGAVVTEYPLGGYVKPGMFYVRNRIISGLSLATLVIEGHQKSGAWVTATYAMDHHHRDVYAVPGPIFSDQGLGAVKWLRDGAICVSSGSHIADDFKNVLASYGELKKGANQQDEQPSALTPDEQEVLQHLSQHEASFDELLEKTKFPFGLLHTVLLSLLVKKLIKKHPGAIYELITTIL